MRATTVWGLSVAALAGAGIASCNFTLGVDPYFNTGGASSSSSSASTGTGSADAGKDGSGGAPPQGGTAAWSQRFGGSGATLTVAGLGIDGMGNLYLTGSLQGKVDLGGKCAAGLFAPGGTAGYVLKLDATGSCVWAMPFGVAGTMSFATGTAIAVDPDGAITLAGAYTSLGFTLPGTAAALPVPSGQDAFVVRYPKDFDPAQATTMSATWLERFGDAGDQAITCLALDGGGNVYAGGSYTTGLNIWTGAVLELVLGGGATPTGFAVLLSSADGASSTATSSAISADGPGDVAVRGIAFGVGVVAVAGKTSGGLNYGQGPMAGHVGEDAFLLTYTPMLASQTGALFGDMSDQEAYSVVLDSSAEPYLAGSFSGTIDFGNGAKGTSTTPAAFLAHLDKHGKGLQAIQLGTLDPTNPLTGLHLALTDDGEVVFAGTLPGGVSIGDKTASALGGNDVVVGRLDGMLSAASWLHSYGGPGEQGADAVAIANGHIFVAGHFQGSLDLGNQKPLTAVGSTDVFVAELIPANL